MPEKTSPTLAEWAATLPTVLVGGDNFTTWPDLKWARACSHIALFEARLREWHASAPMSVEGVLREDRQGMDLVAHVPKGIPTHEWALDLGDAIHNMRCAFDAVAWGMAHFEGAKPTKPKRVKFPIFDEESKWDEAVRDWIGELRPEFQARLRLMQPFNYTTSSGPPFGLSLLHDLDIRDKHKDTLDVSANLNELLTTGGLFEFEDPDAKAFLRLEMHKDVGFTDGAVVAALYTGATVSRVEKALFRPTLRVVLTHDSVSYDALWALHHLRQETRRYLDILLGGLARPDDADEDEVLSTDVDSSTPSAPADS
ncbi:hypothetical protein [Agromyces sp. NPDC055658]